MSYVASTEMAFMFLLPSTYTEVSTTVEVNLREGLPSGKTMGGTPHALI